MLAQRAITISVDTHLRIPIADLPPGAYDQITAALVSANPEDPQEQITLYEVVGDYLVTPRGFALKLRRGIQAAGYTVVWDDQRASWPVDLGARMEDVQPRPYQVVGIQRMIQCEQGIYEAPPGSGKTISACFFMTSVQQRTIILVDKINIAAQWIERIRQATGIEAGLIGDGAWDERPVTVALRQTLWSKREELDGAEWWRRWGAVILDECHGISAFSVRELIQRFPARYRIGLSATPDRHDWLASVSRQIIGEIIRRTSDQELEEAGVLIRPRVIAIKTNFQFDWNSRRSSQTQWQNMLKAIKYDKERNDLFAALVTAQRGRACLVHTDQKAHAHELAAYALAAGWPNNRVFMLTGSQDSAAREKVVEEAAAGDVLIVSTIGQEALDIPRLDRFFLVWPSKSIPMVKQMVGRVKRTHAEKQEAPIVFDFYDYQVGPLRRHFAEGRRVAYARDSLPLEIISSEQLLRSL